MTGYIPTLEQVDELHHRIAQSQAAYDLIHTHCQVVATIARQLAHRRNALFMRRCTLPAGAPEFESNSAACAVAPSPDAAGAPSLAPAPAPAPGPSSPTQPADPWAVTVYGADTVPLRASVPPTDGVVGGTVPPRLIDEHLVVIGGMLHDIGTYLVLKHDGSDGEPLKFDGPNYIKHGIRGYQWLLDQGVDESIAQFARNHTGVGLTREAVERQGLPLPPGDYVPVTLEQETVMMADKFNSKSIPPKFLTVDAYTRKAARFGEDNKREWIELVQRYGVPDVRALAERFHMRLQE